MLKFDKDAESGHYLICLSRVNSIIINLKSKNKWHLAII